jgi:hypothetical protein
VAKEPNKKGNAQQVIKDDNAIDSCGWPRFFITFANQSFWIWRVRYCFIIELDKFGFIEVMDKMPSFDFAA